VKIDFQGPKHVHTYGGEEQYVQVLLP